MLLALAVFAVSCGNDDDDDSAGVTAGTPAPAPAEEPDDAAPAEEAPAEEAPAEEAPAEEAPAEEPEEEPVVVVEESEDVEEEETGGVPTGNTGYLSGGILTTDCSDGRPTGGTLTFGVIGEMDGWDVTLNTGAGLGGNQLNAL